MYRIVGADQKEYGPVSADQVRQWIVEGRANGKTLARFEDEPWKPLATFAEFAPDLPSAPLPPLAGAPPLTGPPLAPLPGAQPPRNHPLAVAGLVVSIVGMTCCGPIASTVGLILSIIALTQINQNPQQHSGKGLAWAGIILALIGYFEFLILLFTGVLRHFFHQFPRW